MRTSHDPASCPFRMQVTTVVIDGEDGAGPRTVRFDDRNHKLNGLVVQVMMRALDTARWDPLLEAPVTEEAHPDDCPLCAFHAEDAPHLYGVWISRDYLRGPRGRHQFVEDVGTAAQASSLMSLYAELLAEQPPLGGGALTIRGLHVPVDGPARWDARLVSADTQLWLWDAAPGDRWWPDRALGFDGGRVVEIPGDQVAATAPIAKLPTLPPRPGTVMLDGITLHLVPGTDRIESLLDPDSATPARRIVDGAVEPLQGAPNGLIVFGRHRDDRPPIQRLHDLAPEYSYLARGVLEGRGQRW